MNKTKKQVFRQLFLQCFFLMLCIPLVTTAGVKTIGTPFVKNYSKINYNAGPQSWMIEIMPDGFAYFANNDGLLEYDGNSWRIYETPSLAVLRSVMISNDHKIYTGAFNEIGFFQANSSGLLTFHSLHQLLPAHQRDFDEVWRIHELLQGVVFQSFDQLMIYDGEKIQVIPAPGEFHFSFLVNGELYINDLKEGFFRLVNNNLVKVPALDPLLGTIVSSMLSFGNHILIATDSKGIYEFDGLRLSPWNNPAGDFLKMNQVYSAISLCEKQYAFGTIQDGLLICDLDGNIIQQVNQSKGLQSNTVLSMQTDQFDNLWLGLDNGIDYIEVNSPLSYFSEVNGLSSGYTAQLHDGELFLGTNRGVFKRNWEAVLKGKGNQDFSLVENTGGQVWKLQEIDGELFCGHNLGTFLIDGSRARKISDIQGGWTYLKPGGFENHVIGGTYSGLVLFNRKNGVWQEGTKIAGFNESSRFIVNGGKQNIWMSHGYKGLFRIYLNEELDSVTRVNFYALLDSSNNVRAIDVFQFEGKPVFTTNKGIYEYDEKTGSFIPVQKLNSLFGNTQVDVLSVDQSGNYWYFKGNSAGVYRRQEDGNLVDVSLPFRQLSGSFINGFQFVYPVDRENVFFGTHDGFVHYKTNYPKNYQQEFQSFVREVMLSHRDSVIFWGTPQLESDQEPSIPFKLNALQFRYSANDFEVPGKVQFSSYLEGYDKDWTSWSAQTRREFTNLRGGDYIFYLKAKNPYEVETNLASYNFLILPPWYLSWWAFVLYALIFLFIIFLLAVYVRRRINKSRRKEEERQKRLFVSREKQLQNDALKSEKEVIRLRNEKLSAEMVQKDKELANSTMQMIQKNKSLIKIRKDLQKLSHEINDDLNKNLVNSLIRKINRDIDHEGQWEVFETHFESVHEEFLKRLKAEFPGLSPRELKLCAYLRLNVSSKEIATLMNISTRGVEISRYRLRKKLDLDRNANLTEFIISF
jgi:ligand-binding sensor domain-containing protein/DNA-binding CsgD family transcriptional regulator